MPQFGASTYDRIASDVNYDHNSSIIVLATVITIVNYDRNSFIIQATGLQVEINDNFVI